MAITLTPTSATSSIRLPITGSPSHVASAVPFKIYTGSADFLSGASDQIAYTYKKLGGDVLDIELTSSQVYAAYEESVLEYSYILNIHQAKNVLGSVLGNTTGTFDHRGNLKDGPLSASLASGSAVSTVAADGTDGGQIYTHAKAGISLKYPNFEFTYARRVGDAASNEAGAGGFDNFYSASIALTQSVQDYNLQTIISSSALDTEQLFEGLRTGTGDQIVSNKKISIRRVYYKTPHAMWRFFGYYGGLNTVGNLQTYGQWADDSQFQIVPVWQNKLQAVGFEDSIYTRNSHYAYEIKNNKIRLFPPPTSFGPTKMWVEFSIPGEKDAWEDDSDKDTGVDGINNMSTIPFANLPYESINSIGKQWVRRFCLAVTKEMLGQIRSKFSTIPIPGDSVQLNGTALITEGKEEQTSLREELKTTLDELTYAKLSEQDAAISDSILKVQEKMPLPVFVG